MKWLLLHIWRESHKSLFLSQLKTLLVVSGSGKLEFEEFCILAAQFLIEEDEEQMRKDLKDAFRFYDKEGKGIVIGDVTSIGLGRGG